MTDSVAIIRLPNRFDFSHHKLFSQNSDDAFVRGDVKAIEIDFSQVQYLDSSALGMLVLLAKKAATHSVSVSIRGAQGTALDILMMANLNKLYSIK
jgi:anti-anti-sigma factor